MMTECLEEHSKYFSGDTRATLQHKVSNWLENTIWSPDSVSVFMRATRTNNDEEWHRKIKKLDIKPNCRSFCLLKILCFEASMLKINCKCLPHDALLMYRRKTSEKSQEELVQHWDNNIHGRVQPHKLLSLCVRLIREDYFTEKR